MTPCAPSRAPPACHGAAAGLTVGPGRPEGRQPGCEAPPAALSRPGIRRRRGCGAGSGRQPPCLRRGARQGELQPAGCGCAWLWCWARSPQPGAGCAPKPQGQPRAAVRSPCRLSRPAGPPAPACARSCSLPCFPAAGLHCCLPGGLSGAGHACRRSAAGGRTLPGAHPAGREPCLPLPDVCQADDIIRAPLALLLPQVLRWAAGTTTACATHLVSFSRPCSLPVRQREEAVRHACRLAALHPPDSRARRACCEVIWVLVVDQPGGCSAVLCSCTAALPLQPRPAADAGLRCPATWLLRRRQWRRRLKRSAVCLPCAAFGPLPAGAELPAGASCGGGEQPPPAVIAASRSACRHGGVELVADCLARQAQRRAPHWPGTALHVGPACLSSSAPLSAPALGGPPRLLLLPLTRWCTPALLLSSFEATPHQAYNSWTLVT